MKNIVVRAALVLLGLGFIVGAILGFLTVWVLR